MPVDIHPENGMPGVELILTRHHALLPSTGRAIAQNGSCVGPE
jgi:hypothetical protein